ncbi:MAG: 30S ribosomal protein S6, partial [Kiritimatiellae bacterium]|nr:30S ribosomal protein S6 [Kiritimatiellia bacterium]
MKQYDALYIFVGVNRDEVLQANLDRALAEVTRLGGTLIGQNALGRRSFARPMKKRDNGVYVKVRFE